MNREEYVEKLKAKLDAWNADIRKLEAEARQYKAQQKIDYQRRIDRLKNQYGELQDKIEELKHSGDDAWQQLKIGVDQAWERLKDGIDKAQSELK